MPKFRTERGWTLIELLIVIALISILAAMGVVAVSQLGHLAKEAVLKTDLFRMRDAIDQYYADKGKYPASLDALVSDGYMRKIPEDPITESDRHLADGAGRTGSGQPDAPSRASTTSRAARRARG